MPMIKYFSSPHMALLWLLARQHAAMLLGLGVAWASMGYLLTLAQIAAESQQEYPRILSTISNVLLIFTSSYRGTDNGRASLLGLWKGIHAQLPVFWPQLVRADLYFIALSAAYLSLCFLIGSGIASPAALLSGPGVLFVPALWIVLAARTVIGAVSSVVSILTRVAMAAAGITVFAFAIYFVLSVIPTDDTPMPNILPLTCLVAIPAVMLIARATLLWAGPRLWRRETDAPPAPAAPHRLVFVESPPEREPFETAWSACQWFFARRLAALATQTPEWLIFALSLLLLFFLRFGLNLPYTVTPYIAGAAGFVYLMNIRYLERTGAVHNLPVSLWTSTVNHLRLITVCISLFYAASFPVYLLELSSIRGAGAASPFDAFWLLWIMGAGLSFAPLLILAILPLLLPDGTHLQPQTWAVLLSTFALAVIVLRRDVLEGTTVARDLWLALVPVASCSAMLTYCHVAISSPAPLWMAREILGGLIVLAALRYNAVTHRIPLRVAWRVSMLLVACVAVAVMAIALFGPPAAPGGAAGLFLGLGVVAPVFLPLLWIPHAIEWARAVGRGAEEPAGENEREVWENMR